MHRLTSIAIYLFLCCSHICSGHHITCLDFPSFFFFLQFFYSVCKKQKEARQIVGISLSRLSERRQMDGTDPPYRRLEKKKRSCFTSICYLSGSC
ncbi:hypothetical protein GLYMA_19G122867v4 [Glycine max]|nr:hypothetical protein GLYMA_19G122867v4 [Glycine max]KAH1077496.1 hypothetical protein GYH30_052836 [Glycine max]